MSTARLAHGWKKHIAGLILSHPGLSTSTLSSHACCLSLISCPHLPGATKEEKNLSAKTPQPGVWVWPVLGVIFETIIGGH